MEKQQKDFRYELAPNSIDSQPSFSEEAESFLDGNVSTRRIASGYSKTMAAMLAILILLLSITTASLALEINNRPHEQKPSQYFLKTTTGKRYPDTVIRTYWDYDDNFLDHNVTIATQFWKGLFPDGDGIVALNDEEVKSLDLTQSARSFRDSTKSIYLVSAFHQLHCLSQLRSLIIKAHQNPKFTFSDPTYYPTMHCVDIVRQQILCHADGTLIYKRQQDKYPGDGGIRVCNNFDALTHWTKEHANQSFPGDVQIMPGHAE
ncbi:unnamed protein product [Colletotrichum noveboracense]|uniref:Tat pathway signal sequence n=1 Tax=Colletotrichum noveboracense TaxID=2664923 RepID=A0A9W4RZ43_9PEZI|nr:hypothetical protein Brms1b_009850 [Colletotrichum noveboracense]CAI0649507.1 unnamed protein product [Colletotrichum noveboracense]